MRGHVAQNRPAGLIDCLSLAGLPVGGKQLSGLAGPHRRLPLENIGAVCLWVNTVPTADLGNGVSDGTAPTRIRMANEQPPFFPSGRGPYTR